MRRSNSIRNAFLISGIAFLICCKKETKAVYQYAVADSSRISITNASPAISNLQFYLNNKAIVFPDSPFSYGITTHSAHINNVSQYHPDTTILPYIGIPAGYQQLGFGSYGNSNIFSVLNNNFAPGGSYSIFIIDTVNHGQVTSVLLQDYVGKTTDSAKSQIRFLNLSPDAPPLDLWAFPNGGSIGYKIFSGCGYLPNDFNSLINAESFSVVNAGPYYFEATSAGTFNVMLEGQLMIRGRNVVTIYTKGYVAGTGSNAMDVGVIAYRP